jgi:hypothetical protein
MPKITLVSGEERRINTPPKYLSIVDAANNFVIESPVFGSVVGEVGRQYELEAVNEVVFVNNKETSIDIEYETANIKITTSGKGVVTVGNEIVVKRIVEAIQVEANATVENGKMAIFVANNFLPIAVNKTSIGAGQTVEVLVARAELSRSVILQLITDSADMGEVRVGSTALNAVDGVFMQGNKDAPAQLTLETTTAIFVHNPTASAVTIGGCEQWRA